MLVHIDDGWRTADPFRVCGDLRHAHTSRSTDLRIAERVPASRAGKPVVRNRDHCRVGGSEGNGLSDGRFLGVLWGCSKTLNSAYIQGHDLGWREHYIRRDWEFGCSGRAGAVAAAQTGNEKEDRCRGEKRSNPGLAFPVCGSRRQSEHACGRIQSRGRMIFQQVAGTQWFDALLQCTLE